MKPRHLFLIAFFILAVVMAVIGQRVFVGASADRQAPAPQQITRRSLESSAPSQLSPAPSQPQRLVAPTIDPQALMQHVAALNYERFQDADRARARAYIRQTLTSAGWQVTEQAFGNGGVNLVAERTLTPNNAKARHAKARHTKAILVGAHYDTVQASPGADDNATSIAVLLEIARLLGNYASPRALRLAFFDQEELGLLGSIAFVEQAQNLQGLQAAIVMDMVGYACYQTGCQRYPAGVPATLPSSQGDFLAVIGNQEDAVLLDAFLVKDQVQSFNLKGLLQLQYQPAQGDRPAVVALPVPWRGLLTPDLLRSDHAPFWQKNIGAVLATDTANFRSPHYHQPSDTPETIDLDFFTKSAQLIVNATTQLLQMAK